MEMIKVVVVEPGKRPYTKEFERNLENMQEIVGGNIESIPFDDYKGEMFIICNEDGKSKGLPLNRVLLDDKGEAADILTGTFFVCSRSGEHLSSLSEKQEKIALERFKCYEMFKKGKDGISMIQLNFDYT